MHISNTSMPDVRVVLVEPRSEGNVGAVARAMRNFAVDDLVLVRPCSLGDEARKRAMHGLPVLEAARTVEDFEDALADADLVVGTSGIDTPSEKRFARISVSPKDLASRVAPVDGVVALAFGREDFGLYVEELERCDLLVTVPASAEYPILNVSHAAAIVLYELHATATPRKDLRKASGLEKDRLHAALEDLMEASEYPDYKRERTRVMFRRMMGRAVPTKWEFHALMGVFQRATKRIRRLEGRR